VVPLKFVAQPGSGHTPSRTHLEYWLDCDVPWISLFDVGEMRSPGRETIVETSQNISALGIANSSACIHPAGTVVLSRTASLGCVAIMGVDMAVSQHFITWTCGPTLLPEYLLYLLRSMDQHFDALAVGTTNRTIFMPDLRGLRIPRPPVDEQREIVAAIRAVNTRALGVLDALEQQASLLAERRQALISAAVGGELEIPGEAA
jgi:type I restriction enzyme S subunit